MDDADAIFSKYAQDPEVTHFLSWRPHKSVEDTREFLRGCLKGRDEERRFGYVIERKADQELLGMIGFTLHGHTANAGYLLAKPFWGNGYMSEALGALREMVLSIEGMCRFSAFCDVENRASARVMEKAGLEKEGVLRRYFVHPNISQVPRDCVCYAATH